MKSIIRFINNIYCKERNFFDLNYFRYCFHKVKYSFLIIILTFNIFNLTILTAKEYSNCGRIILDGYFDDWTNIESIYDKEGDANGKLDILELRFSQDDNYLFFYIKFNKEINLQDSNNVQIYFDTDLSDKTGLQIDGLGADMIWKCGAKNGVLYINNSMINIRHNNIEFCSLPSVTSSIFEFSISKSSEYNGSKIFPNNQFRLAISSDTDGDLIPDLNSDNITINFATCDQIPLQQITFPKDEDNYLRISCWNMLKDNFANPDAKVSIQNILKTIQPEIMGLEELYNTDDNFVESFFSETFPSRKYYVIKQPYTDIVLVSIYPIISNAQINGNAAFLIDLQDKYKTNAMVIVAHLPASQDNAKRLDEVKNIINFIKSTQNGQSKITLEKNSPIFIIGDMNFVGYAEQLNLLMTGKLNGEGEYIDWDSTPFAEGNPRLSEAPFCYTWISNSSSYAPGKLDYIIYSDFATELKKSFSIYTNKMSSETLAQNHLNSSDSQIATDHLPITCDFKLQTNNSILQNNIKTLLSPNPAVDYIILDKESLILNKNSNSSSENIDNSNKNIDNSNENIGIYNFNKEIYSNNIQIFDIYGHCIIEVKNNESESRQIIEINKLISGVYYLRIGYEKPIKFIKI